MPDQVVHDAYAIRFKDVFVMVGAKVLSDYPGMLELAVILIRESYREGLYALGRDLRHK